MCYGLVQLVICLFVIDCRGPVNRYIGTDICMCVLKISKAYVGITCKQL